MGGPQRPGPDEIRVRMEEWQREWSSVATCTDRADRPRAERAISELYRTAGRPEPAFAWVASPRAGAMAYSVARLSRRGIISEHARGDVGNGQNRELNGLAAPFGMDPVWTRRLAASALASLPDERRPDVSTADPYRAASMALGSWAFRLGDFLDRFLERAVGEGVHAEAVPDVEIDVLARGLGPVWTSVGDAIGGALARELFLEAVREVARSVIGQEHRRTGPLAVRRAMQLGQWDGTTPALAAARDVAGRFLWRHRDGRLEHERQIDLRLEIARAAGPWWATEDLVIATERPLAVRLDDRGRPHHASAPAIAWADGAEAYAWHGVPVEPWVIREPEQITVDAIDGERNVETRRVLVERFGEERLIREGGAELISEDAAGRLWRRGFGGPGPAWVRREEPVVMVEVQNATPEADGTRRTYFLRVPPDMRSARAAVAWTFGLREWEYRPAAES